MSQKSAAASVLDHDRIAVADKLAGFLGNLSLCLIVISDPGAEIVFVSQHCAAVFPLNDAPLFQFVQVLSDGHLRDAQALRKLCNINSPFICQYFQDLIGAVFSAIDAPIDQFTMDFRGLVGEGKTMADC